MFDARTLKRILAVALVLSPPALLAILILRYGVNVPYWDQWEPGFAGLFEKFLTGHLSLADLWAQQNEARLFFPRLIFLALGLATHWNVRYEMAVTFLTACLIAFTVYRLAAPALQKWPSARFATLLLSSLLIFSPVQSEAWLWGLELACYIPLACIGCGLLLGRQLLGPRARFGGCAALALISTLSFGNGVLAWVVLAPAALGLVGIQGLESKIENRKSKINLALVWVALFATCESLYFHGYQQPETGSLPAHLLKCLHRPLHTAHFFCCFFGAPLAPAANTPTVVATGLGLIFVVLFVASCAVVFIRRSDRDLVQATFPWITLGSYGLLSGLLATGVRSVDLPLSQAFAPRYGIFAISLLLAVIHLVPLFVLAWLSKSKPTAEIHRFACAGLVVLAASLAIFHLRAVPAGLLDMRATRDNRLFAKTALAFFYLLPEQPATTDYLYPYYPKLRPMVDSLNRIGFLSPPPFEPTNLFSTEVSTEIQSLGYLERIVAVGTNGLVLSGWASSPSRGREADGIVLTWETDQTKAKPFALARFRLMRPDLAGLLGEDPFLYSGWQRTCAVAGLPKGMLVIRAWAFDTSDQAALPLEGAVPFDTR